MNELFEYSNLPMGTKNVIIYGCFDSARQFAIRLLNYNIFFDMFLFPDIKKNYILPNLFNKPVIDIEQCKEIDDYVILVSYFEKEYAKEVLGKYGLDGRVFEIERLAHSIISSSNIILYGSGGRAKRFKNDFENIFNSVHFICDSSNDKKGELWYGKEIISPDYFLNAPLDTVIIIASTYIDEIFNILDKYEISKEQIFVVKYEDFRLVISVNKLEKIKVKEHILSLILRDIKGKNAILYGEKRVVESLKHKLEGLDVIFDDVITRNSDKEDGTIFDMAYTKQDALCVIADKYEEKWHKTLLDMGICEKNIIWIEEHNSIAKVNRNKEFETVLDPNIGHAYVAPNDEYPGFVCHKYLNGKLPVLRIVTLGASTTMSYGQKISSWSNYLSEILKENDIPHIIYCGGVDAYTTSHELLKLIRDVIWMNPDIVISYSGALNMCIPETIRNPFIGYYQEELFEKISGSVKVTEFGKMQNVFYGIKPDISGFTYYYKQLEMMHAVCEKMGFYYKVFFQPVLPGKDKYFAADGDVAILNGWLFDKEKGEYVSYFHPEGSDDFITHAKEFIQSAKEKSDSWFCDLSSLFNDIEGVYMDGTHVLEEGNYIIARRIFDELKLKKDF